MERTVNLITRQMSPPELYLPLSEAEVRQFLRLPELSPPDGLTDQIVSMIIAACELTEGYQHRDLIPRAYRLVVTPASGSVKLRRSVAAVEGVFEILEDSSEAALAPELWRYDAYDQAVSFLGSVSRAAIDFRTAPADLPDIVRIGMLEAISTWWNARVPIAEANESRGVVELPHTLTALLRFGADYHAPAL